MTVQVEAGAAIPLTTVPASGAAQNLVPGGYKVTLSANCTFALAGAGAGVLSSIELYIFQAAVGGPFTIAFPGSVVWVGGVAPTMPTAAGSLLYINLSSIDGGATWLGSGGAPRSSLSTSAMQKAQANHPVQIGSDGNTWTDMDTPGTWSPALTVTPSANCQALVSGLCAPFVDTLLPLPQAILGASVAGGTVTLTVASTAGFNAGQPIVVTGIAGFTTNNPNGSFLITSIVDATHLTYVPVLPPTGGPAGAAGTVANTVGNVGLQIGLYAGGGVYPSGTDPEQFTQITFVSTYTPVVVGLSAVLALAAGIAYSFKLRWRSNANYPAPAKLYGAPGNAALRIDAQLVYP